MAGACIAVKRLSVSILETADCKSSSDYSFGYRRFASSTAGVFDTSGCKFTLPLDNPAAVDNISGTLSFLPAEALKLKIGRAHV